MDTKSRQTRGARSSYKEESDSEVDNVEMESEEEAPKYKDDDFSEEEESPSETGSDWNESSGSEYGKKKKNKVVAAKGRGRKKSGSPSKGGRGRGRPPAKGAGRGRGRPAKNGTASKKRLREDSESEPDADSSGSEYGKKKKSVDPVKKAMQKASPKKKATPKAKKPVPAPSRGSARSRSAKSKSYKEVSEDDDFSEEEVKPVSKRMRKSKPEPEEESDASMSEPEVEDKNSVEEKADDDSEVSKGESSEEEKPAKQNGNKKAKAKKMKEDSDVSEEEMENGNENSSSNGNVEDTGLKNKTDTDYTSLDFSCKKKTPDGEDWNFKIACWNIGGIKAWLKKNGMKYLEAEDPDIMCLQEIKCSEKTRPDELASIKNYPHTYWAYAEHSGFHGVATLCKTEPKNVVYGFPDDDEDTDKEVTAKKNFNQEGRMITTEFENFFLVNCYVPNSGRGVKDDAHPKGYPPKIINGERQLFDKLFTTYVKKLGEEKPTIVTGDLNVAHEEIDIANPKTNTNTAGFTKEEREDFTKFLEEAKLFDSFRKLNPDQKGAYTFWSYMHNSRQKNIGWRLDYFLLSEKLSKTLAESLMRTDVYGSDHCPITLFIRL